MIFLRKINYSKPKVTILALLLVCFLSITPIHTPKAQALWGEIPQQIFKGFLEQIAGMIQGLIMGGLKTAAMTAINTELSNIIGGSASQDAMFITNWQDFLVDQPKETANVSINDYISQTVEGKDSSSSYVSAADATSLLAANYEGFGNGSFSYGMAMNNPSFGKFSYFAKADSDADAYTSAASTTFASDFAEMGKAHTSGKEEVSTITYSGEDIADASDNFANLQLYLSGTNNQWGYDIDVQAKYAELLAAEQRKAEIKAISTAGFTTNSDTVTIPGIIVKDDLANARGVGFTMLATAKDPSEIITAVVQSMITKSIQNGIGQASAVVQREVSSVTNKTTSELNTTASTSGVGALYKSSSSGSSSSGGSSSSSTWTNPDTGSSL